MALAKGLRRGCQVGRLVYKFYKFLLERNEWGCCVSPGALSIAGLVEMLPVVCSKNSSGNRAEGKRRGLFQELGGTPHPLPLPARPYVRKCRRFRAFRSGRVLEPSFLSPALHAEEEALEARRRERTGQQPPSPGRRSQMAGVFLLLFQQGGCSLVGFLSLLLGEHRAWEFLGPDVLWLPESRPAGEESPTSLP